MDAFEFLIIIAILECIFIGLALLYLYLKEKYKLNNFHKDFKKLKKTIEKKINDVQIFDANEMVLVDAPEIL